MREAKSRDYWEKAYRRPYCNQIKEIDFSRLNNIPPLTLPNGILVLCGLNGAGKSTILSAIKDVIGLQLSDQDQHRIKSANIKCKCILSGNELSCQNRDGERLVDKGYNEESIVFLDSTDSISFQRFIVQQTNIDELLEQYGEYELTSSEVDEVNYLIGKRYTSCTIRELDDVYGSDTTVPYFSVSVDGESYDTKSMGYGEHFLLYLFWRINKAAKDTLLILEEPETYISISSQKNFSNYLGKQMAEKGVKVILTTHSPYILSNIKNDNVRIVSRMGNIVSITTPDGFLSAEPILGLESGQHGTFFVEDNVASYLLTAILEDCYPQLLRYFTIEVVGGYAEITKRLMFPFSANIKYKFIGIYDGDMRSRLDNSSLNWKYCFLPGDKAVEEEFRNYMHDPDHMQSICSYLNKKTDHVIAILSAIDGYDCHDWFIELCKRLAIDESFLIRGFYEILLKGQSEIERFLEELDSALE